LANILISPSNLSRMTRMAKVICIIGAMDTKGEDFAYLQAEIVRRGCQTFIIDTGVLNASTIPVDISREIVAQAGGAVLEDLQSKQDRGAAMSIMAQGIEVVIKQLYADSRINGVIAMGGGGGTSIATTAMRALPIGFPKVMVSTIASGDVSQYVGMSDITMMPSVVDVAGLNRISRRIYSNAAGAICGMVSDVEDSSSVNDKPLIAVTMFGNTTRAVNYARTILENEGYEVMVFHATGAGGRTMEALIANGYFSAVLDMTTTEWADELCGGVFGAGPERLDAAARAGIPQIVVPGCIDMCNFMARNTVPEHYDDRLFYEWNPDITLMRTTPEETRRLGELFAEKLNSATHSVAVYIPLAGVSEIDIEGKPFHSPVAIEAFVSGLKATINPNIPVIEIQTDINDPAFARQTANALLQMLKGV